MKVKNKRTIENFDPVVLKHMILFSLRSKRAISFQKDYLKYEKEETVYEFIVTFFLDEVQRIIITKPLKEYNEINDDLYYIKGKINIKEISRVVSKKVNCTYGELSLDNALNQIIKYIIYYLLRDSDICSNKNLKRRLTNIYYYFNDVKLVDKTLSDLDYIKWNKENKHYESLILICRYILGCIQYNENTNQKYIDIDSQLWWVYQEFLRNYYDYYKNELNILCVSPSKYEWNLMPIENSHIEYLPKMNTDIELNLNDQHIIIDAKCYEKSLIEFYHKKMFIPDHLYQLKSYLEIYKYKNKYGKLLRGILIYPYNASLGDNVGHQKFYDKDEHYIIEIVSIDFKQSWEDICNDLNNLLVVNKEYNDMIESSQKNH